MLATLTALAAALSPPQEVPTVILQTPGPFPPAPATYVIDAAEGITSNARGGWSSLGYIRSGSTTDRVFWGSPDRSAPVVLLSQSTATGSALAPLHAYGAGRLLYDIDRPTGCLGRGLVLDGTTLACAGSPSTVPGYDWYAVRALALSATGEPLVHAAVDGGTVPTSNLGGVFSGATLDPLVAPGTLLPGTSAPVDRVNSIVLSPRGEHYGCTVRLTDGSPQFAVVDGVPLMLEGQRVRIGGPVHPVSNPTGPTWTGLHHVAMSETGSWWILGSDSGPGSSNTFLMRDGEVVVREGGVVDGYELRLFSSQFALGAEGSALTTWGAFSPTGVPTSVVLVADRVALHTDQVLDVDGDGTPDPGNVVLSATSNDAALDEDRVLRVLSRTSVPSTTGQRDIVQVQLSLGEIACEGAPNSTGLPSALEGWGTQLIGEDDLRFRAVDLPPNVVGYLLASRAATPPMPVAGSAGNLCLGGSIGRYAGAVLNSGAGGVAEQAVDLERIPQPTSFAVAAPGESWSFQFWHRDAAPSGGATSNFSGALTIRAR